MSNELTVVVVTHNSEKNIEHCLNSLKGQNVIVVDNNSKDDTITKAIQFNVKIIQNKSNLGYGKAANQAIKQSNSKYILLLNPDVIINNKEINKMLKFLKTHKDCDIVGPMLVDKNNNNLHSCRRFPTLKSIAGRRLNVFNKDVNYHLMSDYNHKQTKKVDWVSGACIMFKRNLKFDERFFLYFEDVDLCRNRSVYYLPAAVAYHEEQRASKHSPLLLGIHLASMVKYFVKHNFK